MWRAFAFTAMRDIGEEDFAALESGVCPRRINGTMSVRTGRRATVEEIDLSERASPESGQAFAQAIRDYCRRYPA